MPDRPEGDHRRRRFGARLRAALILLALIIVAATAATAGAVTARKGSSAPSISEFSFSPKSFVVGATLASTKAKRVTTIRYHLSKRASVVVVTIARRTTGRRSRGRCVRATAKLARKPACARYVARGRLVRSSQRAGDRSIPFSGRLGGAALSPGQYRATIVASDSHHRRSRVKTTRFTVTKASSSNSGTPPAGSSGGPAGPQRRNIKPCTVTVADLGAVTSAVNSAAPGSVVCLAPGSYGKLSVNARKASEVTIQPAGIATIAGADLNGSHLTLEGFNVVGGEVTIEPGSDHMTVQFNRISGGPFGLDAGPTTTTTVNDVTIRGNQFVGNFGEDAMRLNRYHDGDGDGVGILIEGNEITGVVEDGAHNDCLQTVWVGDHLVFRRNWLHGNNCQGFFVKDQASAVDGIVVDDNLIVDHNVPCQPASLCPTWVLSPVQVFGPLTSLSFTNNTVWTPFRNGGVYMRGSGWGSFQFSNNVTYRLEAPDGNAPFASYSSSNNVTCNRASAWPAIGVTAGACSLPFPNPAADDYRLNNGRGVDWAPAEQHYGP